MVYNEGYPTRPLHTWLLQTTIRPASCKEEKTFQMEIEMNKVLVPTTWYIVRGHLRLENGVSGPDKSGCHTDNIYIFNLVKG